MSKRICPVCGMGELQEKRNTVMVKKYGMEKQKDIDVEECPVCGAEIEKESDKNVRKGLTRSLELDNVHALLNQMEKEGENFSSLERACGLPQRTLSKWKNGATDPTVAGTILVNLLYHIPWLCNVIDYQYDASVIKYCELSHLFSGYHFTEEGVLENQENRVRFEKGKERNDNSTMNVVVPDLTLPMGECAYAN